MIKGSYAVSCHNIGSHLNSQSALEIMHLAVAAKLKGLDYDIFLSDMEDKYFDNEEVPGNEVFNITTCVYGNIRKVPENIKPEKLIVQPFGPHTLILREMK